MLTYSYNFATIPEFFAFLTQKLLEKSYQRQNASSLCLVELVKPHNWKPAPSSPLLVLSIYRYGEIQCVFSRQALAPYLMFYFY